MNEVIKTERISKKYKDVLAVSEVSLHIAKGEIYGFLGLNGAGKTTTIRMLLGMISPSNGAAYINGSLVTSKSSDLWKEVGYLVEIPYSYPELTVFENLEIIRKLRGIKNSNAVSEVIDKLKLTTYSKRKAKNLSLGNAQRLGLAKALIHKPSILILDEPANGLDPAGILEIRELLSNLAINHGVTIFISSHILSEISRFATRIGIIHNGILIQEISTSQLEHLCRKQLIINTRNNILAEKMLAENGFRVNHYNNDLLAINEEHAVNSPDIIAELLVNNNVSPLMLNVTEEDLESYFLRTISEKGDRL